MNRNDLNMLAHLRKDGRMPLTRLSRLTNVPVSTIFDRLRSKHSSLFSRFTALIDFNKLGFGVRVYGLIKVKKDTKDEIRSMLENHININSLFRVNNGYDYLIDCLFRNMGEVEEFIDLIEEKNIIKNIKVHYVIENIMQESFIDSPEKIKLLL